MNSNATKAKAFNPRRTLGAMATAAVLSVGASVAQAGTILFDTDGAGASFGAAAVSTFDWAPGNILANNCLPAPQAVCTIMMQASISAFKNGNSTIAYDSANREFSMILTAQVSSSLTGDKISFLPLSSSSNRFEMYYDDRTSDDILVDAIGDDTAFANNLTGRGFRDGTLILSGTANIVTMAFTQDPDLGLEALDQFNSNNYGATTSVVGTGSARFEVDIDCTQGGGTDTCDTNFFKGDFVAQADQLLVDIGDTGNSSLAFDQADPSQRMFRGSAGEVNPDLGNGNNVNDFDCDGRTPGPTAQCDLRLQGDAASTFRHTAVAEPNTVALLGLACGIAGLVARSRRRKAA